MSAVRVERDGPLAILTIDHPPLNFFDHDVAEGFAAAFTEIEADHPRAMLIRADGNVVSGGVDVHEFEGLSKGEAADMFRGLLDLVHRVEAMPFPTVFAAHALTLTAAFELSLGCDIILAARGAQFGLVEIVVGLTPAMGGTQRLAERAGPGRAREFVMTGRLYDADTMERWNVVNRVWDDDEFDEAARRYATRLANGPTKANAATKRVVREYLEGGVKQADAAIPEIAGELFQTEDLSGAVQSFLKDGPGKATYEGR